MKKQIVLLAFAIFVLPVLAQETNSAVPPVPGTTAPEAAEKAEKAAEKNEKEFKKRHLKLMEKALDKIGVTEEQREKIFILQDAHMEKMKENWIRLNKARRALSDLQETEATLEKLEVAIQEVSDAQTEQLRILVTNRKEMESILGKEKYDLLMKMAHEFFQKHGRRPGGGLPPRPGDERSETPPPPSENEAETPPPFP